MPPRWPRVPTRLDPAFRRSDDQITFATHVALFCACNSGMWFFRIFHRADWSWSIWMTSIWFAGLAGHWLYVYKLADYSGSYTESDSEGV